MAGHRPYASELSFHAGRTVTSNPLGHPSLFAINLPQYCANRCFRIVLLTFFGFIFSSLFCPSSFAQESPYIVTYDHYLEEPGSLEVEYFSTFGTQRAGNDFHAFWVEFEYGAKAGGPRKSISTGKRLLVTALSSPAFRWENRFRLLKHEHFVNPVLYIEYERKNGADKILKEVEGVDVESDFADSNATLRQEHVNELEFKLLLSTTFKGWNIAVNPLAAKNLSNNPWEFGYAVGASRPLALKASPNRCAFCPENFIAGVEMYGGLGDRYHFGLHDTSQYLAPGVGLESSLGLDPPRFARLRLERQQPPFPDAVGRISTNFPALAKC